MRVISGKHRSRHLEEVGSNTTRETKDRVKESLFGTIHFDCQSSSVLDLFTGSGALGIEALSRGADMCDLVDVNQVAIKTVRKNLEALDLTQKSTVYQQDYKVFLDSTTMVYDLIFLDPPYKTYNLDLMITKIAERKLLKQHGKIILLTHKSEMINEYNHGIIPYKTKTKGITKITFLRWSD
jgi:16S rRNA (guanine(966)-N(2))-methyltransferase RsmD